VLFSEPKIPQFAGNSPKLPLDNVSVLFSEPKIPQFEQMTRKTFTAPGFSALQRAENSSITRLTYPLQSARTFQCSSASRKFLNHLAGVAVDQQYDAFQCSSASRKFLNRAGGVRKPVRQHVSVLFSEPKIPQYVPSASDPDDQRRFQCSSASRKFLNRRTAEELRRRFTFQCSSASRKFLNFGIGR